MVNWERSPRLSRWHLNRLKLLLLRQLQFFCDPFQIEMLGWQFRRPKIGQLGQNRLCCFQLAGHAIGRRQFDQPQPFCLVTDEAIFRRHYFFQLGDYSLRLFGFRQSPGKGNTGGSSREMPLAVFFYSIDERLLALLNPCIEFFGLDQSVGQRD